MQIGVGIKKVDTQIGFHRSIVLRIIYTSQGNLNAHILGPKLGLK